MADRYPTRRMRQLRRYQLVNWSLLALNLGCVVMNIVRESYRLVPFSIGAVFVLLFMTSVNREELQRLEAGNG